MEKWYFKEFVITITYRLLQWQFFLGKNDLRTVFIKINDNPTWLLNNVMKKELWKRYYSNTTGNIKIEINKRRKNLVTFFFF